MPKKSVAKKALKVKRAASAPEFVIITGMSGAGKATVLNVFEDLGFNAIENLPIELVPKLAELISDAKNQQPTALVIDIREGQALKKFPTIFAELKRQLNATIVFLDAGDQVLQQRYSETRRPHPLGTDASILRSIKNERTQLEPIRKLADHFIDTSKLNVHEARRLIVGKFRGNQEQAKIQLYINSFGFRHGVPSDSDLVFDVRFLPNPNYIPEFKKLSGRHPQVARYIRTFPQTTEFINRIADLLIYLLPHYIAEGKSYLTISFGCTGGRHRSVLIAHEIQKRLAKAGFSVKENHRDISKS